MIKYFILILYLRNIKIKLIYNNLLTYFIYMQKSISKSKLYLNRSINLNLINKIILSNNHIEINDLTKLSWSLS